MKRWCCLRLVLLILMAGAVSIVFAQSPYDQDPSDGPFGGPAEDIRQPQQNNLGWITKSPDPFRALEMYFHSLAVQDERQRAEEKRDEMLKAHELRQKAAELVETCYKLEQKLQNPFVSCDEPAELIQKSEKLAKSISQLMR